MSKPPTRVVYAAIKLQITEQVKGIQMEDEIFSRIIDNLQIY